MAHGCGWQPLHASHVGLSSATMVRMTNIVNKYDGISYFTKTAVFVGASHRLFYGQRPPSKVFVLSKSLSLCLY